MVQGMSREQFMQKANLVRMEIDQAQYLLQETNQEKWPETFEDISFGMIRTLELFTPLNTSYKFVFPKSDQNTVKQLIDKIKDLLNSFAGVGLFAGVGKMISLQVFRARFNKKLDDALKAAAALTELAR